MAKDPTLFSEVKKDIREHLGSGKLYEVVVSDRTRDGAHGMIHLLVDDDRGRFPMPPISYGLRANHKGIA